MGRHHMPDHAQAHGPNAPTVLVGGPHPLPRPTPDRPPGTRTAAALVLITALFVAFMAGAATQNAIEHPPATATAEQEPDR